MNNNDITLKALKNNLDSFNKEQGKPNHFTVNGNSITINNIVIDITIEYLALQGLYTLVQSKETTLKQLVNDQWVSNLAVRHNHLVCKQGGNKAVMELKDDKNVVKTSVSFDTETRELTFKLAGKGDINHVNVILASHLYSKAVYDKKFKAYSSNLV